MKALWLFKIDDRWWYGLLLLIGGLIVVDVVVVDVLRLPWLLLWLGMWIRRWLFNSDRAPAFVDLKEVVRRAANRLSLLLAADRDLFKIEAADNTALVDGTVEGVDEIVEFIGPKQ